MKIQGTFASACDDDSELVSICLIDVKTGEVSALKACDDVFDVPEEYVMVDDVRFDVHCRDDGQLIISDLVALRAALKTLLMMQE